MSHSHFLSSLLRGSSSSSVRKTYQIMNEEQQKFLYFAYGSNLSSDRIRIQSKSAVFKAVALLRGYKLGFCYRSNRWGGSAADIIAGPLDSAYVYGVLWELENHDLANLDKQEGVAFEIYKRVTVKVDVDGTSYECLAYQLTEKTRTRSIADCGEEQAPSKMYKSVILKGAKEHQLPPDYITFLESIEDNGEDGLHPAD